MNLKKLLSGLVLGTLLSAAHADVSVLNVSYDRTLELHQDFNAAFAKHWQAINNEVVSVRQSQGGSGK